MSKFHLKWGAIALLCLLSLSSYTFAGWGDFFKKLSSESTQSDTAVPQTAEITQLAEEQITSGLKEALAVGTENAIQSLGKKDGFLKNATVKIPLPKELANIEKTMRLVGQGQRVDEFITTMNRAAEAATPEASKIIGDAIREMTVKDAQKILNGQGDEATQYFQQVSDAKLKEKLRPIIEQATGQAGVTQSYKKMTGNLGTFQSIIPQDALDLDGYVTTKALSGLYHTIGEEEKKIRSNPTARTTDLLKKVFGAQK